MPSSAIVEAAPKSERRPPTRQRTERRHAARQAAGWRSALLVCLAAICLLGTPARSAADVDTNQLKWRVALGEWPRGRKDSSPAVAPDGTSYVGSLVRRLWAVSPKGEILWSFRTGSEIRSSPAVAADGTIYFGCRDRYLYALTPEGKLKWRFATGWWVDSSPGIGADGTVYFGSWDRKVYAVTPTGQERWSFATGGPVFSSPAIAADGTIYIGSNDGHLYALSADWGKKWAFKTGGPVISSPAIRSDGAVCFTSVDGGLYVVAADGKQRWRLQTGGFTESSPVLDVLDRVFLVVNRAIWAVSATGEKRWAVATPFGLNTSTAALTENGLIYYASRDGYLYVLGADGIVQAALEVVDVPEASVNLLPDGTVLAASQVLDLVAINRTNRLAPSAWPMFRQNPQRTGRAPAAR
jgi:outer membrane protein assembly factor BamB